MKSIKKYCLLLFAVMLSFSLSACSEPVDTVAIPELQFAPRGAEEIQTPEMKRSISFDKARIVLLRSASEIPAICAC